VNEQLTVEQAQAKLHALTQEGLELSTKITQAEQELELLKNRRRQLDGGWNSNGLIGKTRNALARARRHELDSTLRNAVWESIGSKDIDDRYVIDKVTAKRIFVRLHGSERADQYAHDGKPVSYGNHRIDIAATFGPDGPVPGK
jgi:hypothetical protein